MLAFYLESIPQRLFHNNLFQSTSCQYFFGVYESLDRNSGIVKTFKADVDDKTKESYGHWPGGLSLSAEKDREK